MLAAPLLLYTEAEPRCKHAQPTSTLARLAALALRTHNFSAHQMLPLFCWLLLRCLRRLMSLPQAVNQPKFNQQRRDAQGCDAVSFARTLSFLHPTSAASTLTCQKLLPGGLCYAILFIAGPPCLLGQAGCSLPAAHGLQPCSRRCSCVPLRTCAWRKTAAHTGM